MAAEATLLERLRDRVGERAGDRSALEVLVSSLMLVAGKVATMGFGFLAWIVAARLYPASEVGLASGALSAVTLCAQFALIGAGSAVITLLPHFDREPGRLLDTSISLLTVSALVAGLAFLLFAQGLLSELRVVAAEPSYALLFLVMSVAGTLGVLFDQASTARRRGHQVLIRGVVAGVTTLVAIVVIGRVLGGGGSELIFVAWVMGGLVTWSLGLVMLGRAFPGYRYRTRFERPLANEVVRVGLPNYVLTLTERAPGFVLPIVVTELLSPADNAHWYIAWMMAWVVFVIPIQVGMTSFAEIARAERGLGAVVRQGVRTSLVLGVVSAVVLAVFAGPVLGILGAGYREAGEMPLRVLLIGTVPLTFIQAYFSVCRARQRLSEAIPIGTVNSIASVVAPAIVGPTAGLVGMAIAWLAVQLVTSVVAVARLRAVARA